MMNRVLRTFNQTISELPGDKTNRKDLVRLSGYIKPGEPVKLHFGSGPRVLKGWLNFDLSFEPYEAYLQYYTDTHYPPAIRGTREDLFVIDIIHRGIPLPDNSVDLIFHEDFFEHLTQKEQIIFLAETLRVMKPGAIHRINTPNLAASMRDNSHFEKGREGVFTGEWDYWHHYSVMSPAILAEMAKIVGYTRTEFNSKNKSVIADQLPLEYRPDEKNRTMADSNVFADLAK